MKTKFILIASFILLGGCVQNQTLTHNAKQTGEKFGNTVHQVTDKTKSLSENIKKKAISLGEATKIGANAFWKAATK